MQLARGGPAGKCWPLSPAAQPPPQIRMGGPTAVSFTAWVWGGLGVGGDGGVRAHGRDTKRGTWVWAAICPLGVCVRNPPQVCVRTPPPPGLHQDHPGLCQGQISGGAGSRVGGMCRAAGLEVSRQRWLSAKPQPQSVFLAGSRRFWGCVGKGRVPTEVSSGHF